MNAQQFIKDHGVEKARKVVEGAPTGTNHYCADNYWFWDGTTLRRTAGDGFFIHSIWGASEEWVSKAVSLPDLKRLVKAVELVAFEGGLDKAKNVLFLKRALGLTPHADRLEQAIADYEAIYSNDCEILDHPEDYTSPNCKKFDERVK